MSVLKPNKPFGGDVTQYRITKVGDSYFEITLADAEPCEEEEEDESVFGACIGFEAGNFTLVGDRIENLVGQHFISSEYFPFVGGKPVPKEGRSNVEHDESNIIGTGPVFFLSRGGMIYSVNEDGKPGVVSVVVGEEWSHIYEAGGETGTC